MTADELAKRIDAEVVGAGGTEITAAATLEEAGPGQVSFLANPRYLRQLEATRASAVIVSPRLDAPRFDSSNIVLLKARDPYYAFRQAVVAIYGYRRHTHQGVHPKAHVEASATIGEGTVVYPGAYVGAGSKVGRDCVIYPNVTIYDACVIGDRCILHAGTSIGPDGYGFATSQGVHHKIPQVGNVVIEDDVEIGSNCMIARAALGSTVIGKGTKIDGEVVIGHGAKIGPHCLLVAQSGVAGSTTLGHHVTLAGQVGVAGHLKIGDEVMVAAQSGVMSDVEDKSVVMGAPAMPASHMRRVVTLYTQLPDIVERIKNLEQQFDDLADSGDTPLV